MKTASERLYNHVEFLTGIQPARSFQHLSSLNSVANYIRTNFDALGFSTRLQTWEISGHSYHNVIASCQPENKRRLIIGAHYDVCGNQPGADDNASGVAGLLELAYQLAALEYPLPFGIDFVAYSLEEPPFFDSVNMGSYIHASSLDSSTHEWLGMIALEMIGYFSDEPESQGFYAGFDRTTYSGKGDFIAVVGNTKAPEFASAIYDGMLNARLIDVKKILFADSQGLGGMSDHRNYWRMNIPALMINDTAFLRNPHYHKETDRIETLNFEKMAAVCSALFESLQTLENELSKPEKT